VEGGYPGSTGLKLLRKESVRLYSDLDETLVTAVPDEQAAEGYSIQVRPGADWFIRKLALHGDPWLLTWGIRRHARKALARIGPAARLFRGVLSREDLMPVYDQVQVVLGPGIPDGEREALWRTIAPIAPPGIVFDDFPVNSELFAVKSRAVGIGGESWIEVEAFDADHPDRDGLRKAYMEFERRVTV
jgi:hypothetical protein